MIRLEFMNKNETIRNKVVEEYYNELIKGRTKVAILDKWCDNNLNMKLLFGSKNDKDSNSFKKIVTANLSSLLKVRDFICKNNIKMSEELKKYMTGTMYESIDRIKFVNTLGVKVCPYCNRNYINSSKNKTHCQFDHFINKNKYPILATSFYNLVPVCPSCNHIKSDDDFSYSPYDDTVHTDEIITFSYLIKGINYLNDASKIEIVLKNTAKLDLNVEKLKLKDL